MKLRPFELAMVIIFVVLAMVSLIIFANYEGSTDEQPVVAQPVDMWGTLPAAGVTSLLESYAQQDPSYSLVRYRYVPSTQLPTTLVNALADNIGPDMLLISQEDLATVRRRILPESYETFPFRDIRDLYVDGADIFALQDGLQARPLAVDPLMLYWNRDLLTTAGFLNAPRTWEELVAVQFPELIDRGFDRTVSQSVVAMGEYSNVRNGLGMVSMLLLQGGSAGVIERAGVYEVALNTAQAGGQPLRTTLDFYTRFSRPDNTLYSWNRALPTDRQAFLAGDLAFYFGYLSEGPELERLNPNLNFDIAEVPQAELATLRRTYGRIYGLTIMRTTDNYAGAQAMLAQLSSGAAADWIALNSGMAPARRDSIAAGSNTFYGRTGYQSAAIAYGWLNPALTATNDIFTTMVEDVNENRRSLGDAASDAVARLSNQY